MIAVNEIYGPVKQGEGKTAGMETMFLRLSGCNLACDWCDSPYTWNWLGTKFVHPDKYDKKKEVNMMDWKDIVHQLHTKKDCAPALVISGGEPMLQQKQLVPLLNLLRDANWWIEVETNGTIEPTDEFVSLINQFNCSPKTSNSGPDNPLEKRIVIPALVKLASLPITTFKFVITNALDLVDARGIIATARIKPEQIWLMPESRTTEEHEEREEAVREIAQCNGYHFSPRLQVLEFGNKRAV
jgi:7-carboxy-7-deazaguanine synthase